MNNEKGFSSKEVAEILRKDGYEKISDRTVNYYAFDKSMFSIEKSGKKVFTQKEIDKIKGIRILQDFGYTLDKIKEIVNTKSLSEIESICYSTLASKLSTPTVCNKVCDDKLNFFTDTYSNSLESNLSLDEISYIKTPFSCNKEKKTIKINDDVTLVISNDFDYDKLQKIIEIINK